MKKLRMLLILIMALSTYVVLVCDITAGTIYKYVDKDGLIIYTDNPPSGVKAIPKESFRDMTESEKETLANELTSAMEKHRQADKTRRETEEKIRMAREEYKQAMFKEEKFRSNMNQASGFIQRQRWRKELEEQKKEVQEKKKKLEEIETSP